MITIVQLGLRLFVLWDNFQVQFNGDRFAGQVQLFQQLRHGQLGIKFSIDFVDFQFHDSGFFRKGIGPQSQTYVTTTELFASQLYFAMIKTIVLGTRNRKKRLELEQLLADFEISIKTLDDFPDAGEVEENGSTFAENAAKKAREYAQATGQWTVCDDSGISVDFLDGAPGIYSARFAGTDGDDQANNDLLLQKMEGVPRSKRGAYYTANIALADPQGQIQIQCERTCRGVLRTERDGQGGFGYDPLFELPEYHMTFGQLGVAAKRLLSHRARAMRDFLTQFKKLQQELT